MNETLSPDEQATLGNYFEASSFRKALEHTLNRHSKENGSNTPDFLLAEYLADCLAAFDRVTQSREAWYGRPHGTNGAPPIDG